MGDLRVSTSDAGGTVLVTPEGALDLATAERLEQAIAAAERRVADGRLVLDFSALEFMDSTGLQVLLDADVRAAAEGRALEVVTGDGAARRVLELADALPRLKVTRIR